MTKLKLSAITLQKLPLLIGSDVYNFLGFTLYPKTGIIEDKLNSALKVSGEHCYLLSTLLSHYASANPTPLTGKLVKFKDIPGGYAYADAFLRNAVDPVAKVFGNQPDELLVAARLLGGTKHAFGDVSVEINALKGIPLTYVLWMVEEFPASASILYDESASNYLPTEDLAVLGELTTSRLVEAANGECGKVTSHSKKR